MFGKEFLYGYARCSNRLLEKEENGLFVDELCNWDVGGIGEECFASFKCSVKDANE